MYAWIEKLRRLGPCKPAIEWAKQYATFHAALDDCWNGSWLVWLAAKKADSPGWPTREQVALTLCNCAEAVEAGPSGDISQIARTTLEVVRRWARGKATLEEVRQVGYVARSAYATAITYDAADATRAYCVTAYVARVAAADAPIVAAQAVAVTAYAALATVAATAAVLRESAVIVKAQLKFPEEL